MFYSLILMFCLQCICQSSAAAVASELTTAASVISSCGEYDDCITLSPNCTEKCGCDGLYIFNETENQCQVNSDYLKKLFEETSNLEERLRLSAEKVFNGIIISVFIFISCAGLCTISALIYCCRMNYKDYKLHQDLTALAQKLNRDGKLIKPKKVKTAPVAESCNVVVQDVGVFVC